MHKAVKMIKIVKIYNEYVYKTVQMFLEVKNAAKIGRIVQSRVEIASS